MNDKNQTRTRPIALVFFAALMLALMLPLRLWQQLHLVEQGTGFWVNTDATVTLLYVALGVLVAVPAIAGFALRKRAALDLTRRRRVVEGAAAALVAAALVWDAFAAFGFAVRLFGGGSGDAFLDGMEMQSSPVQFYIRSGAMACVLESLSGLAGALFFGTLAAIDFAPEKKVYLNRALALAPFAWAVCRVLRRFSRTIAYLRVSDLFLGLAMLVALMLFLLAFAQIASGVNNANKGGSLLAAGIPAAVLAVLCFVPRFVAYGFMGYAPPQDAMVEWCDSALAVFILALVIGRAYLAAPGAAAIIKEKNDEMIEEK